MKYIFSEFGDSLILIAIGIAAIVWTHNPEPFSPENTNFIDGILAEDPKEGAHDHKDYIGVWIGNGENFYEFSGCSYNDRIASAVKRLKKGDRFSFYALKGSSSITFPWTGKKYRTYKICDAVTPEDGRLISFEQFNRCNDFQSNKIMPILSGILILMGIFRLVQTLKDKKSINKIGSNYTSRLGDENAIIRLRPDKLTFVLRNSALSIFLMAFGLFFNYVGDGPNTFAMLLIFSGIYALFHYILIHDKIYYLIDSSGIHIKKISFLFQSDMNVIQYNTIEEVICKQAFYESGKNIGTVLIDNGQTNSDGDKIHSKLVGIENHETIARLILQRRASLK